jgi:hypothetical protein
MYILKLKFKFTYIFSRFSQKPFQNIQPYIGNRLTGIITGKTGRNNMNLTSFEVIGPFNPIKLLFIELVLIMHDIGLIDHIFDYHRNLVPAPFAINHKEVFQNIDRAFIRVHLRLINYFINWVLGRSWRS